MILLFLYICHGADNLFFGQFENPSILIQIFVNSKWRYWNFLKPPLNLTYGLLKQKI